VCGAEKLSVYFGKILKENYPLTDTRLRDHDCVVWAGDIARYEAQKAKEGRAK